MRGEEDNTKKTVTVRLMLLFDTLSSCEMVSSEGSVLISL
jgi:hypothetical protein